MRVEITENKDAEFDILVIQDFGKTKIVGLTSEEMKLIKSSIENVLVKKEKK